MYVFVSLGRGRERELCILRPEAAQEARIFALTAFNSFRGPNYEERYA